MAVNAEFQELWRKYSIEQDEASLTRYLEEMKKNLTTRNGGTDVYVFHIIDEGKAASISSSDYNGLLAINGDMNPQGK